MGFRGRYLFVIDAILLSLAYVLSFGVRFDTDGIWTQLALYWPFAFALVPAQLLGFVLLHLYRRAWRYAGPSDALAIGLGIVVAGLSHWLLALLITSPLANQRWQGYPRSIILIDAVLALLFVGGIRAGIRGLDRSLSFRSTLSAALVGRRRVLVVGAGSAGAMIVREMALNPDTGLVPVAFVDDDPGKQHLRVRGVPVMGTTDDLARLLAAIPLDEVIIAMPRAPGAVIRKVLAACEAHGVSARTMPGVYELISGRVSIRQIREVQVEDLLRREPASLDLSLIEGYVAGRTVVVTGAGGSIGSELCRQLARYEPARLVLVGRGENSIYNVYTELKDRFSGLATTAVIADVRDRSGLERALQPHRPAVVFHAAAHKHVPMMEANVAEAVSNNVLGTWTMAEVAAELGAERFVLISTDKAVNPTSVMGATKRVAELVIQNLQQQSGTVFCGVRFGNVLGSRGSVVPRFLQQIAVGGPVTVTHPDMTRYFMTIPEAVQLVLSAAALAGGGEIFVLDMGEPVKIVDLARDLIHLCRPGYAETIEIVFSGLRPGEKLFEELATAAEELQPTALQQIMRIDPVPVDPIVLAGELAALMDGALAAEPATLRRRLFSLCGVPARETSSPLG